MINLNDAPEVLSSEVCAPYVLNEWLILLLLLLSLLFYVEVRSYSIYSIGLSLTHFP